MSERICKRLSVWVAGILGFIAVGMICAYWWSYSSAKEETIAKQEPYVFNAEDSRLWFYAGTQSEPVMRSVGRLGLVAGIATLVLVFLPGKPPLTALWIAFVCWTLLPPLWFCFEYIYVFKAAVAEKQLGSQIDEAFMIYNQGLALSEKMWLAMVAVVTARLYRESKSTDRGEGEGKKCGNCDCG